jgi:predicted RNA-binding Zn ribbon-like protein
LTTSQAESATAADLAEALELREALRRLLIANNGGPRSAADVDVLDRMALRAGLRLRFGSAPMRVMLEPAAAGVAGALGRLVAVAAEAVNDGSWSRLKACAEHTCQWAFYDRTKNHSGHWCQMMVCGNRSKARQFRQRRRRAGVGLSTVESID